MIAIEVPDEAWVTDEIRAAVAKIEKDLAEYKVVFDENDGFVYVFDDGAIVVNFHENGDPELQIIVNITDMEGALHAEA